MMGMEKKNPKTLELENHIAHVCGDYHMMMMAWMVIMIL